MGDKCGEASVGDRCWRQVGETSGGDKWETSVNSYGPKHPEWETSVGDKWETSVNSYVPRKKSGRQVWETSGRQV